LETATQEKAQALGALADAEKRLKESNARLVELAKDAKSMRERFDAGNAVSYCIQMASFWSL
jgi:F0F1-type ATP synthase membrane subunit b/b'